MPDRMLRNAQVTEVINFLGPWKSMAQVEWETLKCKREADPLRGEG